jgi:hypothetical protein
MEHLKRAALAFAIVAAAGGAITASLSHSTTPPPPEVPEETKQPEPAACERIAHAAHYTNLTATTREGISIQVDFIALLDQKSFIGQELPTLSREKFDDTVQKSIIAVIARHDLQDLDFAQTIKTTMNKRSRYDKSDATVSLHPKFEIAQEIAQEFETRLSGMEEGKGLIHKEQATTGYPAKLYPTQPIECGFGGPIQIVLTADQWKARTKTGGLAPR